MSETVSVGEFDAAGELSPRCRRRCPAAAGGAAEFDASGPEAEDLGQVEDHGHRDVAPVGGDHAFDVEHEAFAQTCRCCGWNAPDVSPVTAVRPETNACCVVTATHARWPLKKVSRGAVSTTVRRSAWVASIEQVHLDVVEELDARPTGPGWPSRCSAEGRSARTMAPALSRPCSAIDADRRRSPACCGSACRPGR